MIKYIVPENCRALIKINTEDAENVKIIEYTNTNINYLWIVDEDGEFNGKPVKKGNIIIKFYDNYTSSSENMFVIVNNEELTNTYAAIAKRRQEYLDSIKNKDCEGCQSC